MKFKKPELEDLSILKKYFEGTTFYNCGYTPAMIYLWSPFYNTKYAKVNDMIICCAGKDKTRYSFPIGTGDAKAVLDETIAYCEEQGQEFEMYGVTKDIEEKMREMYGDTFTVEYDRDSADYVYLSEKLISLSGKKLHSKRNHINRFNENHNWTYEELNDDNALECLVMLMQWKLNNCLADNVEKHEEICVSKNSIMYYKELGLTGGIIRCEGHIIAFAIGEPLNNETYVVHIEKAFSHIQGAYPIINQQFVLHAAKDYKYINREEDCGEEGLRKAKLSYRPEKLEEIGILKFHKKQ